MSRAFAHSFSIFAATTALALPAWGQAVISTRSGVIHYFEGTVSVAGQPLEARLGKFATIPEGAELRTDQGRAEVLLTPGVFLRMREMSAIRMVASVLSDTRVELLAGSAIVESGEPAAGTSVTLIYKNWTIRQPQKGLYRLDSEPARLQVLQGEAEVSVAGGGEPIRVEEGMEMPFASVLVPEKTAGESRDALTDWAEGRSESISTDNSIAANIQDPASMDGSNLPADAFTYFPMLGYTVPAGLSGGYGANTYPAGVYGYASPYSTGFYSVYLPGYTRRPLLLRLPSSGLQRSPYSPYSPTHLGLPPLQHGTLPRPVTTPHPVTALPHGPARIGGHR
ncbi:MAG: hypothetical protein WBY44_30920 [Bryobacteraceae bacterium]